MATRSGKPRAQLEALERAGELELRTSNGSRARELYERALRDAETLTPPDPGQKIRRDSVKSAMAWFPL
jgi:hypothetical protein